MARVRWLLALLVAPSTVAVAAPNAWTLTGPQGGPAWSMEYASSTPGDRILAVGPNAVDGSIGSLEIWDIAVDPEDCSIAQAS